MKKDDLDKYLAHLPARNTRREGTPPPASTSQSNKAQTQHDIYKNFTRSSFGVRGPRGPSKAAPELSRRTTTSDIFACGNGTNNCGSSNIDGPDTNTTSPSTTDTKYNDDTNITNLMNGMDLNESNNSSSSVTTTPSQQLADNGSSVKSTDTPKQLNNPTISNTGKYELERINNKNNSIYESGATATTITTPTKQPNAQVSSTQQQPMPPIPTFSFGNSNTSNEELMPPIPTFSFGVGDDDTHQDNKNDDDKDILNLALGLRCGGCDKLISGMAITAAGHRWHPDCFKCQHCHQDLEHVAFYEKDGLPYCALDYHELFTMRCQYCHTPIEEKSIHALGKYYHVGHFFCRECGKPFDEDSTFMEHDGYPYCEKDYLAKFAHKCKGCKEDITNDFLEALDGKWHITCFVCVDCGKAFESNTFYVRNNLPYCERHSRRIKQPA